MLSFDFRNQRNQFWNIALTHMCSCSSFERRLFQLGIVVSGNNPTKGMSKFLEMKKLKALGGIKAGGRWNRKGSDQRGCDRVAPPAQPPSQSGLPSNPTISDAIGSIQSRKDYPRCGEPAAEVDLGFSKFIGGAFDASKLGEHKTFTQALDIVEMRGNDAMG